MIETIQTLEGDILPIGPQGLSAYGVYKKNGGTLSEEEWLESLKGETGLNGVDGKDGLTPTIGENGNWFIGDVDTGMPSRGATGEVDMTDYPTIEDMNNAINEVLNSSDETTDKIHIIKTTSKFDRITQLPSGYNDIYQQVIDEYFAGINVGIAMTDTDNKSLLFVFNEQVGSNRLRARPYYLYEDGSLYRFIFSLNFNATTKKLDTATISKSVTATFATKTHVDNVTGDLTTLGTEDKSNLVNAINEVMNSGSGITELTEASYKTSDLANGLYLLTNSATIIYYNGSLNFGVANAPVFMIKSANQCLVFDGGYMKYYLGGGSYKYNLQNLLSSDKLGTYTLTKTNTTSYTPTSDYHPATKKYVDDVIANAITTTLEGSY